MTDQPTQEPPQYVPPSVAVWQKHKRAHGGSIPTHYLPTVMDEARAAAEADIDSRIKAFHRQEGQ